MEMNGQLHTSAVFLPKKELLISIFKVLVGLGAKSVEMR
jgi:hypothetical protein